LRELKRGGRVALRKRAPGRRLAAGHARLAALPRDVVRTVRGRGLWAGVEFASLPGREVCERLAAAGVLAKETHANVIRLAPPLVIDASRAPRRARNFRLIRSRCK